MPLLLVALGLFLIGCGGPPLSQEGPAPMQGPAADGGGAAQGTPTAPDEVACSQAGPQSPRDLDQAAGASSAPFTMAPPYTEMHLCDIHYHRFAEHRASGFPTPAGEGKFRGFACLGQEPSEDAPPREPAASCGETSLGDTVEVHWVFTTCDSEHRLGNGLGTCVEGCDEALLRVEGRVFYLTRSAEGELDFADVSDPASLRLPPTEAAVEYAGSTTGSKFNVDEVCSAIPATWSMGRTCAALSLDSLDAWCGSNVFGETKAHGVRSLVQDLTLLAPIE